MPAKASARNDRSNGWESVSAALIARRQQSIIGVATVLDWAQSLPSGGSILDLGCGSGMPVSHALREHGFVVYGIDAAPSLIAAFSSRFPDAPATCEPVEDSDFFGRRFDGVVAVGLMFLLSAATQRALIGKVGRALQSGGRFLFMAPLQSCTWADLMTGRESLSLGLDGYRAALIDVGLTLAGSYIDEGENHYFSATRLETS